MNTTKVTISEKQIHILKHSLGLTRGNEITRNHFVTGEGSDDFQDCEDLVANKLMYRNVSGLLPEGDFYYCVTPLGKGIAHGDFNEAN